MSNASYQRQSLEFYGRYCFGVTKSMICDFSNLLIRSNSVFVTFFSGFKFFLNLKLTTAQFSNKRFLSNAYFRRLKLISLLSRAFFPKKRENETFQFTLIITENCIFLQKKETKERLMSLAINQFQRNLPSQIKQKK